MGARLHGQFVKSPPSPLFPRDSLVFLVFASPMSSVARCWCWAAGWTLSGWSFQVATFFDGCHHGAIAHSRAAARSSTSWGPGGTGAYSLEVWRGESGREAVNDLQVGHVKMTALYTSSLSKPHSAPHSLSSSCSCISLRRLIRTSALRDEWRIIRPN